MRGGTTTKILHPEHWSPGCWRGGKNSSPDPISEQCSFTSGQNDLNFLLERRELRQGRKTQQGKPLMGTGVPHHVQEIYSFCRYSYLLKTAPLAFLY